MGLKKKIGIIGAGNMGAAILAGLIDNKIVTPSQVMVYDKILLKAKEVSKRWKVRLGKTNTEVVTTSDIVLLAVKPQDLFEAAREFQEAFSSRHVLISILAGTPLAKLKRAVGGKPAIVRAMPNLGAQVGEAITALAGENKTAVAFAEKIFSGCGKTVRLEEKYFDLVTAISGSGPAYFFLLMELLAQEGRSQGLSQEVAEELAVQTAVGAGLLAKNADVSPAELRQQVTSKGGTTEAALKIFETEGLADIVSKGIQAALKRGKELSGD